MKYESVAQMLAAGYTVREISAQLSMPEAIVRRLSKRLYGYVQQIQNETRQRIVARLTALAFQAIQLLEIALKEGGKQKVVAAKIVLDSYNKLVFTSESTQTTIPVHEITSLLARLNQRLEESDSMGAAAGPAKPSISESGG